MARAKSELRPCGIASGPVAASGHPNPWEFAPDPPKRTIGKFMRQLDRFSDGGTRRNHAHVDLLLARKTDSGNRCNASLWSVL
jgi:hypothetical protein